MIGIDEVGRGCWAGPLVAAAVDLDDDLLLNELDDSKKLSAKKRSSISVQLQKLANQIGIGWVWPHEINEIGLTASVKLAMQRAIDEMALEAQEIVIDGNINYLDHIANTVAVVRADGSVQAVSAASVIAKVARDAYMVEVAKKYPEYGFEKHVGYGTKMHSMALEKHGVLPIHRINYKPVKALMGVLT